jgi:5-methylcytosine-specific restriction endonuclease McrA
MKSRNTRDGRDNFSPGRVLGRSAKWREYSRAFLAEPGNQICVYCRTERATVVDHVRAHKGEPRLFWSRRNHAASCVRCNSQKAAATEGGFGNPARPTPFKPRVKGCGPDGMPTDPLHPWNAI